MIKARVIDTETASLKGGVVEIAKVDFIEQDGTLSVIDAGSHLINPERRIEWGAMGVHGVTNEMVVEAPTLAQVVDSYLPNDSIEYFIGHNISFDIRILGEDFSHHKTICTLALARKLIDKNECGDHKNSTLFYYLGCYKTMEYEGAAHRALYDSYMTYEILKALMIKFNLTLDGCYDLINTVEEKPRCWFAKYKGKYWKEVVEADPDYVVWLLDNDKFNNKDDALFVTKLMEKLK